MLSMEDGQMALRHSSRGLVGGGMSLRFVSEKEAIEGGGEEDAGRGARAEAHRTLYEQLQAKQEEKDREWEEEQANHVPQVSDAEIAWWNETLAIKEAARQKRVQEEEAEVARFKAEQARLLAGEGGPGGGGGGHEDVEISVTQAVPTDLSSFANIDLDMGLAMESSGKGGAASRPRIVIGTKRPREEGGGGGDGDGDGKEEVVGKEGEGVKRAKPLASLLGYGDDDSSSSSDDDS